MFTDWRNIWEMFKGRFSRFLLSSTLWDLQYSLALLAVDNLEFLDKKLNCRMFWLLIVTLSGDLRLFKTHRLTLSVKCNYIRVISLLRLSIKCRCFSLPEQKITQRGHACDTVLQDCSRSFSHCCSTHVHL